MLAIEVEYLLGRSVATDPSQRDLAEWPPHPARLFSALVDALADVRSDGDALSEKCEGALRWLESQPCPELAVSLDEEVSLRTPVKFWVSINDEVADKSTLAPLVERRKRQERYFPAVVPADSKVVFVWQDAVPSVDHEVAIDALAARVPYLGHSSSVVRVARRADAPETQLSPEGGGNEAYRLRVPGPGRLDRLEAVHAARIADSLIQPPKGREVVYREKRSARAHGPHDASRLVILAGRRLSLEHFAPFIVRLRAALLSHLGDDAPPVLTGHEDGKPTKRPHIAFAPLANVGHGHADGTVKGIAVFIPRDIEEEDRLRLDEALARVSLDFRGTRIRTIGRADARQSVDADRYRKVSSEWISVTPVVLGRYPKPGKLSAELIIADEVERVLGIRPADVIAQDASFVPRAARANETSRGRVSAAKDRLLRHVYLRFDEPVKGPILVGAGRHMGFGLLMPRTESARSKRNSVGVAESPEPTPENSEQEES